MKQVLFLHSDEILETISMDSINMHLVEVIKTDVAYNHNVPIDTIVVKFITEVEADESPIGCFVSKEGLMLKMTLKDRKVIGIRQAFQIETPEQVNKFMHEFGGDIDRLLFFNSKR